MSLFFHRFNQNNMNRQVELKPITAMELKSINEEIEFNKNKSNTKMIQQIEAFIQAEKNGNKFYNNLSKVCIVQSYKKNLQDIGHQCEQDVECIKDYYKKLTGERFIPKDMDVNIDISLKEGLKLGLNEEIKSYNKLCDMIEKMSKGEIDSVLFRKLGRINLLQFMAININ